jgi:hypothetical protein
VTRGAIGRALRKADARTDVLDSRPVTRAADAAWSSLNLLEHELLDTREEGTSLAHLMELSGCQAVILARLSAACDRLSDPVAEAARVTTSASRTLADEIARQRVARARTQA